MGMQRGLEGVCGCAGCVWERRGGVCGCAGGRGFAGYGRARLEGKWCGVCSTITKSILVSSSLYSNSGETTHMQPTCSSRVVTC